MFSTKTKKSHMLSNAAVGENRRLSNSTATLQSLGACEFPKQSRLLLLQCQICQLPLDNGTENSVRAMSYLCNGLRGFQSRDFSLIFCSVFYHFSSSEVTKVRRGMRLLICFISMVSNLMHSGLPRVSFPPSEVSHFISPPCFPPP